MEDQWMKYFDYQHLPDHLQEVSKQFWVLADTLRDLPNGHQKDMAYQKLLEAKDCAVRARL